MDIGNVRPVITGITTPVPKAPAQDAQAVETDLPARATINEPARTSNGNVGTSTDKSGGGNASGGASSDYIESKITMMPDSNLVVYTEIDSETRQVVDQIPSEARLRFRVMLDSWLGNSDQTSTSSAKSL
jgi:hypothetical protein